MRELALFAAALTVWFVLNAWILPRFGIKT